MRVKLSFTAEVDDILSECSYLLNNKADELRKIIELFNGLVENLRAEEANAQQIFENIDSLRKGLAQVDMRTMEVEQIVSGYVDHQRSQRTFEAQPQDDTAAPPLPAPETAPNVAVREVEVSDD